MTDDWCNVPPKNCPLSLGPAPKRKPRYWHSGTIAAILAGVIAGSFVCGMGWALFSHVRPPVIWLESRMLTNVVAVDGSLSFRVEAKSDINHACLGSITREFYTPIDLGDGESIRRKKRLSGPAPIVHANESDYVIDVDLPPNMEPGEWAFQGETTYDCGYVWALMQDFPSGLLSGGVVRIRTPEMPFMVVAKPAVDRK